MKRCKTCVHWTQSASEWHECKSPKVQFARIAHRPPEYEERLLIHHDDEKPLAADEAGVLDGSGYWGILAPGPDFGCVHHEEARGAGTQEPT